MQLWKLGLDHTVLIVILPGIRPPVQTRVVLKLAVPAFENIDFAVSWPLEGVEGEHPVGWPDSGCRGSDDGSGQIALRLGERLPG